MIFSLSMSVFFFVAFILLLLSFYIGTYLGKISVRKGYITGKSTFLVEGTLLSLMLSFTFGLAASKYDKRRSDLTSEVNNISTVLMRTQLYPDSASRDIMRELKPYIKCRIDYYNAGNEQAQIDRSLAQTDSISNIIFDKVSFYAKRQDYLAYTQQMVPALADMFDIVTEREVFRNATVPVSVLNLLLVVSIIVSFLNGYNQENDKVSWVQGVGFSLLVVFSFLLIIDFNNNRAGKINLDNVEKYMTGLQKKIDADLRTQ